MGIINRFAVSKGVVDSALHVNHHLRKRFDNERCLEIPQSVGTGMVSFGSINQLSRSVVPLILTFSVVGIEYSDSQIVNHCCLRTVVVKNKTLVKLESGFALIRRTTSNVKFFDNNLVYILVGHKKRNLFYGRCLQRVAGTVFADNHHVPSLRKTACSKCKDGYQCQ